MLHLGKKAQNPEQFKGVKESWIAAENVVKEFIHSENIYRVPTMCKRLFKVLEIIQWIKQSSLSSWSLHFRRGKINDKHHK